MDNFVKCQFFGKILKFHVMENESIIWNGQYNSTAFNCNGQNSVVCTLDHLYEEEIKLYVSEQNRMAIISHLSSIDLDNNDKSLVLLISPYSLDVKSKCYINKYVVESFVSIHDKMKCLIKSTCKKQILVKMRNHVAYHILKHDIDENEHLCGFCGLVTVNCKIGLVNTSGYGINSTVGPKSNCKYFYKFSMKQKEKAVKSNPCTNRPIECKRFEEII